MSTMISGGGGGGPDPNLRRWMMFVDGENLTLRAQEIAKTKGIELKEGPYFLRDTFAWIKQAQADQIVSTILRTLRFQPIPVRCHYYTSFFGDDPNLLSVRQSLHKLGFHAEVFKKIKREAKAKGVDIALTKDLLSHAFLNNYDVAILIAGDGDYVPLIKEVKRLGKVIYTVFFSESGLNKELVLESDLFIDFSRTFFDSWADQQI